MRPVRLGTRGSRLAMVQARPIASRLAAMGFEVEWIGLSTRGDRWLEGPLGKGTAEGLFTTELDEALLGGEVDLTVHSLKDVALRRPEGLVPACIPTREDPLDWLVMRRGAPEACTLGTSSLRRERLLGALRPKARFTWIRGNVPTRLEYVRAGTLRGEPLHGAVFAAAGLLRLGIDLSEFQVEKLGPDILPPGPGQGALLAEARADRPDLVAALVGLHDPGTEACVSLERGVLEALGGGCSQPLGVLAELRPGGRFCLRAAWGGESRLVRAEGEGRRSAVLEAVVGQLLAGGAGA